MLIRVIYKDGRQDRVKKAQLSDLIEHQQIKMFKRFYGWVSVSGDLTREKQLVTPLYEGRDRRSVEPIRNDFLDEPSDV